ncbi:putative gibberellin 3-beta-dioxygenase [Dioscorea sansibarensis]
MPSLTDHFEFETVREVPESHAWPSLDDHPSGEATGHDKLPLISLANSDDDNTKLLLRHACQHFGVFYVTGHGISTNLLSELELQSRRLFSLPTDQKLKAARPPDGVSGYGLARISSFFSKLMWYEGFTISGSVLHHARQLFPDEYFRFCQIIEEYKKEMKKLAEKIIQLMISSLGIKEEELNWSKDVAGVLQLNSYPACPDPDKAMGLAAHTDSSLLTILHQSGISGLQVLRREDGHGPRRWITVPPLAGALIVHVGDLSHILSNARFHSVLHRAIVNRHRHRYSMAYICGPPPEVKVKPLISLNESPVFRPMTWPEYLSLKGKLFNQALHSIRVTSDDENFMHGP